MSSKPRKMNIRAKSTQMDVDALIAQAGAPSPALPAKGNIAEDSVSHRQIIDTLPLEDEASDGREPPWNSADVRIRKTVLLYLTEREKIMLDYIRERTSVPSQRLLARVLLPVIEAEAISQWDSEVEERARGRI